MSQNPKDQPSLVGTVVIFVFTAQSTTRINLAIPKTRKWRCEMDNYWPIIFIIGSFLIGVMLARLFTTSTRNRSKIDKTSIERSTSLRSVAILLATIVLLNATVLVLEIV